MRPCCLGTASTLGAAASSSVRWRQLCRPTSCSCSMRTERQGHPGPQGCSLPSSLVYRFVNETREKKQCRLLSSVCATTTNTVTLSSSFPAPSHVTDLGSPLEWGTEGAGCADEGRTQGRVRARQDEPPDELPASVHPGAACARQTKPTRVSLLAGLSTTEHEHEKP